MSFFDRVAHVSMNLLAALIILVVGLFIIKYLTKLVEKLLEKSKIDKSIKPFLNSTINVALKVYLIIIVVDKVGIDVASIVAILGAAAFAIALAFQGTLANLASGIVLLFMKPIRVGDYIETSGKAGTVEAIQFFSLKLITLDNKVIFIPNSTVLNSSLVNYSMMETRRLDQVYGVDYASDIDQVKRILEEEIANISGALQEPSPFVALSEHADSSINFVIRVWVKSEDYWNVHFGLLENVKKRFDKENINIPYPVLDIRQNN